VRISRRPSLPFPSSTKQSRAALPSPVGWAKLALRARPHVIHAQSYFGIGLEALMNGAWLNIPVVGTNHTTIAGFAGHMPVSVEKASAYAAWFFNKCDYVTAPSRSVFDELGGAKIARPIAVISNPIDTSLFSPGPDREATALRAKWCLSGPLVSFAGRLAPEKNIEILLHALAALRARGVVAQLALAGHGSSDASLRQLAATLGIADQMRFLGTLPQPELASLLRLTDVFALMSTSETQSMVLLQAMACGVPVVAADSRALPEFVGPESGVLTHPHDADRLAAVLEHLLAAPETRHRMGSAGRQRALKYGVAAVADSWEELYQATQNRRLAA
jgi:glycosyltransferase involved in cell wall biosynthesis